MSAALRRAAWVPSLFGVFALALILACARPDLVVRRLGGGWELTSSPTLLPSRNSEQGSLYRRRGVLRWRVDGIVADARYYGDSGCLVYSTLRLDYEVVYIVCNGTPRMQLATSAVGTWSMTVAGPQARGLAVITPSQLRAFVDRAPTPGLRDKVDAR